MAMVLRYRSSRCLPPTSAYETNSVVRPQDILDLLLQAARHVFSSMGHSADFRSCQSALEAELRRHAFDTMRGVDVFHEHDLVARCRALPRHDGGVGEEVFPDLQCRVNWCWVISLGSERENERRTRNHLFPYFASTFSLLPIQFRYHRHRVAE